MNLSIFQPPEVGKWGCWRRGLTGLFRGVLGGRFWGAGGPVGGLLPVAGVLCRVVGMTGRPLGVVVLFVYVLVEAAQVVGQGGQFEFVVGGLKPAPGEPA